MLWIKHEGEQEEQPADRKLRANLEPHRPEVDGADPT